MFAMFARGRGGGIYHIVTVTKGGGGICYRDSNEGPPGRCYCSFHDNPTKNDLDASCVSWWR